MPPAPLSKIQRPWSAPSSSARTSRWPVGATLQSRRAGRAASKRVSAGRAAGKSKAPGLDLAPFFALMADERVLKVFHAARQDIELLSRLPVPGARGPVTLGNVATLTIESGPIQIDRYDRQRNVNFEVELNGQALGEIEAKALALPSLTQLPPGISRSAVGDAEAMADLFSGFALAMAAGVLCIYAVLVLLFRDFVQPATILAALVLSVPGAFLALVITRTALTMPSMIGLIMLMGIATKNSILLVDYVVMARRDHGLSRWDALIDACRKRARPIVMTTIAMGAGMMPIALGLGADPSFRAPMAIVVIGGLITSTFLSLLVIPVVFTFVDDLMAWGGRWGRRLRSRPDTPGTGSPDGADSARPGPGPSA